MPRVLALYQTIAVKLTNWENHAHQSTHNASLTLKTFALSSIVAYLGLGLSAFVYVPFGEGVMRWVQAWLFGGAKLNIGFAATIRDMLNGTVPGIVKETVVVADNLTGTSKIRKASVIWDASPTAAHTKLDHGRLREQMFAYTVTNQVMDTFQEVGLPFILRRFETFRKDRAKVKNAAAGGSAPNSSSSTASDNGSGVKKRVVFEDEKERGGMAERQFLDKVRQEAALPGYDLFEDYSEMVIQFGYVVLWGTIWPLAGGTLAF